MASLSQTAAQPQFGRSDADEVARLVKAASTSFYGAMRILPRARRDAIFAVYAFCRAVDDIADDEGAFQLARLTALGVWRNHIDNLYNGVPTGMIGRALAGPVARFGLKRQDFLAVIDGMEMDARGPIVAPSQQELDLYCDRVASAVGRLCVCIFGEPGENGRAVAHHLGRALQMTNILRDIDEDARIGRLYLPRERLDAFGMGGVTPQTIHDHGQFARLWRSLAQDAAGAFTAADLALRACNRRKMRPARIMMEIYRLNLSRMMALDDHLLADRSFSKRLVSKREKLLVALRYGLV